MENNKLVKQNETGLAPIPGLEDSSTEDLVIPRIKVSGKRGLFENQMNAAAFPKLDCVLLTRLKSRAKFVDNFPECRSFDRVKGSLHGECASCRFAGAKDDKGRLVCPLSYDFLLMLDGNTIPYVMTVSSLSALNPARKYVATFLTEGKPLYAYRSILSYEKKKKENKETGEVFDYFALVFDRGPEVDRKNQEIYHNIMNKFRISSAAAAEVVPEVVPPEDDLEASNPSDIPF